jgi:hypothetical protein
MYARMPNLWNASEVCRCSSIDDSRIANLKEFGSGAIAKEAEHLLHIATETILTVSVNCFFN